MVFTLGDCREHNELSRFHELVERWPCDANGNPVFVGDVLRYYRDSDRRVSVCSIGITQSAISAYAEDGSCIPCLSYIREGDASTPLETWFRNAALATVSVSPNPVGGGPALTVEPSMLRSYLDAHIQELEEILNAGNDR